MESANADQSTQWKEYSLVFFVFRYEQAIIKITDIGMVYEIPLVAPKDIDSSGFYLMSGYAVYRYGELFLEEASTVKHIEGSLDEYMASKSKMKVFEVTEHERFELKPKAEPDSVIQNRNEELPF